MRAMEDLRVHLSSSLGISPKAHPHPPITLSIISTQKHRAENERKDVLSPPWNANALWERSISVWRKKWWGTYSVQMKNCLENLLHFTIKEGEIQHGDFYLQFQVKHRCWRLSNLVFLETIKIVYHGSSWYQLLYKQWPSPGLSFLICEMGLLLACLA